jgi:undecaprenyl-diphosphatase
MNINIELFNFINHSLANPVLDAIMPVFTNFGGLPAVGITTILVFLLTRHYKKDEYHEIAKLCLYSLVLSVVIAAALKLTVHEPRPGILLDNVRQLVTPTEPYSFPSGHTSSTFSVITVLAVKLRENKAVFGLCLVFALAIAFSRVYVGAHFPLDVLAGTLIGVVSGVVVLRYKNQK